MGRRSGFYQQPLALKVTEPASPEPLSNNELTWIVDLTKGRSPRVLPPSVQKVAPYKEESVCRDQPPGECVSGTAVR